jgi:hypothetical protein
MKTQKDRSLYLFVTVLGLTVIAGATSSSITLILTGLLILQLLVALNSAATGGLAGSLALSYVRR